MKKGRGHSKVRQRTGEQLKKQTAMLHIFWAKSKASRRGGKKVSYIFLDVWSEPKGPPLQGHNAIKHSEMKCLIGGDKGGRGGREGSNRGCSQASRMKARAAAWWGWRRWLGWGQEMHEGYSGCRAWVCDSLERRSWPSQTACSQMTNAIIYEWLGRTTRSPLHRGPVHLRNVVHWNNTA